MNWDQIEGNWKVFRGKVRANWGKLTNDDLEQIGGKREELAGRLQKAYGYAKDRAEREIDDFTRHVEADREVSFDSDLPEEFTAEAPGHAPRPADRL